MHLDMKRVLWSLAVGGAAVAAIWIATLAFDQPGQGRLFPDCLLLPGLWLSLFVPDSHFNGATDSKGGPVSTFVFFAANVALYGGVAYLVQRLAFFFPTLFVLTRKSRSDSATP